MYYNVTIKVMGPLKYQGPDLFVISTFFEIYRENREKLTIGKILKYWNILLKSRKNYLMMRCKSLK